MLACLCLFCFVIGCHISAAVIYVGWCCSCLNDLDLSHRISGTNSYFRFCRIIAYFAHIYLLYLTYCISTQLESETDCSVLQVLRTMLTYQEWKEKYVTSNEQGLYVSYNAQGHSQPTDAVTVSEASG